MTEASKFCEHCGAKTVEYKHTFSESLAVGLFKLYSAGGGPINLKDLSLTRNQWDNFQKLRYWQLVGQSYRKDGTRMSGYWHITSVGKIFIESGYGVYKSVWTYRGDPVRFEGDTIFFNDIHSPVYMKREDYSNTAVPHDS